MIRDLYLGDLAYIDPESARRIVRELFALNACSHAATARALRVGVDKFVQVVAQLGLRDELRAAESAFCTRFADPEKAR
jgi:hypothetical protein